LCCVVFLSKTAELEVPELYQLQKEVWEEEEDEEDGSSQSSESLLRDDVSIASERSLTFDELQRLPVTTAENEK
jgi:hypothetical protein